MLVSSHDGWTWIIVGRPGRRPRWLHVRRRTVPLLGLALAIALAGGAFGVVEHASDDLSPRFTPTLGQVAHATSPELMPPEWSSAPAETRQATVHLDDTQEPHDTRCSGRRVPDKHPFGGRIALTFDDGPNPETTPRLVEILRRHRVPATFFINGERVEGENEKAIVRDLVDDPLFLVGNHGWSHANLAVLSLDEAEDEIDRTTDLLRGIENVRFFRFPFGRANCETLHAARERGLIVTGWHVSSADWCFAERDGWCRPWRFRYVPDRLRQDMVGFVLRQVTRKDGGIVLLHDRLPFTVETLEPLIAKLEAEEFSFVALDDRAVFPRLNAGDTGD